jgi:predicted DNA-binding protein (MmcQ/YjbR family)
MNLAQFDKLCKSLPSTTMVIQWSDSHVHKIGGKLFAMAHAWEGKTAFILKATPLSYQILLEQNIATRAPYLTRGNWLQIINPTKLSDADLTSYIRQSYQLIASKLPKATRAEIGLQ